VKSKRPQPRPEPCSPAEIVGGGQRPHSSVLSWSSAREDDGEDLAPASAKSWFPQQLSPL